MTDLALRFSVATCYWLVQQALADENLGDATHREVTESIEGKVSDKQLLETLFYCHTPFVLRKQYLLVRASVLSCGLSAYPKILAACE